MRNKRVSVIMPCYNSEGTLAEQLEALCNQTYQGEWELIIADNGSADATLQIAENYRDERLPNLKIIDASDVKGAGHARNRGVEHAGGEYILFCDSDDVVGEHWMEEMVRALGQHEMAAPKFEHFKLNDKRFARRRAHFQTDGLINNGFYTTLVHAGGSGLGVLKEVHETIGGFDESFLAAEDWDYCWRAQLAGYHLNFVPSAVVHIRHRSTLKKWTRQAYFWGTYYILIVKKYRIQGIEPPTFNKAMRKWKKLLVNLTQIREQTYRDKFYWEIFYTIGKIKGAIKFRSFTL